MQISHLLLSSIHKYDTSKKELVIVMIFISCFRLFLKKTIISFCMFDSFQIGTESTQNKETEPTSNQQIQTPLIINVIDQLDDDLTNPISLKIPPNAFNLFIDEHYKIIQQQYPLLSDNEIMRELGRIWLSESNEFKDKFRTVAKQMREQFKADNPAFIPRPSSKKKKMSFSGEREVRPINVKVIINDAKEINEQQLQQEDVNIIQQTV